MSDVEKEIRELREKTESNRRRFLETELETCFIALDQARMELSLGETHEAEKELQVASRGAQVIEKFLAEGELPGVSERLTALREAIEAVRRELEEGTAPEEHC